jgi:spermidine synthase
MSFKHSMKRLLSFVYPILIEKIPSEINGDLELSIQNGKLVVDSKQANYSFGSLHDVFRKIINEFKFDPTRKETLVLGFGAGSIATILNQERQLKLKIDGVDLDPVLLELYRNNFAFEADQCTLIPADALQYLESCTKQYDYIFIDVFVNLEVPKELRTNHFIELLQKVSNKHTQLAMNTMLVKDDDFVVDWISCFGRRASMKRYHSDNLVLFKL